MVAIYSNPSDTVFDPFMGSGTTGMACQRLGRDFIGCEANPTYFSLAEQRLGINKS
jgi:site-specific DNA-methyltransferase (adenine-specific)